MDAIATAAIAVAAKNLGKPIVESACRIIERLTGEPLEVVGSIVADKLRERRFQNWIRVAARLKTLLDEKNLRIEDLPRPSDHFLYPLLNGAGEADDSNLNKMWAHLLFSGIQDEFLQHPAFIRVLCELSGLEARILERLYTETASALAMPVFQFSVNDCEREFKVPPAAGLLCMRNLIRVGLCEGNFMFEQKGLDVEIHLAPFGFSLCEACVGPKPITESV